MRSPVYGQIHVGGGIAANHCGNKPPSLSCKYIFKHKYKCWLPCWQWILGVSRLVILIYRKTVFWVRVTTCTIRPLCQCCTGWHGCMVCRRRQISPEPAFGRQPEKHHSCWSSEGSSYQVKLEILRIKQSLKLASKDLVSLSSFHAQCHAPSCFSTLRNPKPSWSILIVRLFINTGYGRKRQLLQSKSQFQERCCVVLLFELPLSCVFLLSQGERGFLELPK